MRNVTHKSCAQKSHAGYKWKQANENFVRREKFMSEWYAHITPSVSFSKMIPFWMLVALLVYIYNMIFDCGKRD